MKQGLEMMLNEESKVANAMKFTDGDRELARIIYDAYRANPKLTE